ncbi:MAG: hypothetical protein LBR16_00215 [Treponema sp.]|jgi:hypothetical protein|nr:hypothetical protein [Treponema sp.]
MLSSDASGTNQFYQGGDAFVRTATGAVRSSSVRTKQTGLFKQEISASPYGVTKKGVMMAIKNSDNPKYIQDLENTISVYEKAIGHFASRTRQMLERKGNVGALEALMTSADLQHGFKVLRDKKMLDKSFESVIVKYQDTVGFSKTTVETARFRLDHPDWDKGV